MKFKKINHYNFRETIQAPEKLIKTHHESIVYKIIQKIVGTFQRNCNTYFSKIRRNHEKCNESGKNSGK